MLTNKGEAFSLEIKITLVNANKIKEKCTIGSNHFMYIIVGDSDNNLLYFHKI